MSMPRLHRFFVFLLSAAALLGLLALFSSTPYAQIPIAAILAVFVLLCVLKPHLGICLFLFALPIFGNKPGTQQAHLLLACAMALQLGLGISFLIRRSQASHSPLLLPSAWYLIISALSLFPVSALNFWGWFRASQTNISDAGLFLWNLGSVLLSREDDFSYPVLSVFWTALAVGLAYFVQILASESARIRLQFCWALLLGLIVSLLVGLLNYYGQLNLDWLRGLDPVVNPGGIQYRVQSWFGHSGWFAEYITLLAPFCMLMLTLKLSFWLRVSLLLFLLLVGELVLILTFQRGGWLSYPLTLLAMWASVYVLRKIERGEKNLFAALRSSVVKILISLPITILISFIFLRIFGSNFGLEDYSARFRDISKASDRIEFIEAGAKLGSLLPLYGLGSESFATQYRREYRNADGAFYREIDLPLHGTAHNLYAQTFAGKGLVGVLSLVLVIAIGIIHGLRYVLRSANSENASEKIVALSCSCALIACFIYGFVQELFYVQVLQYVFFTIVGIGASISTPYISPEVESKRWKKIHQIILCSLVVLFGIHLLWGHGSGRSNADSSGCYAEESDGSGKSWRWCGMRSSVDLPSAMFDNKELIIESAPASDKNTRSQLVEVRACDQLLLARELRPSEQIRFTPQLDRSHCPLSSRGLVRVNTSYGNFFIPAQQDKASGAKSLEAKILEAKLLKDRRVLALRWIWPKPLE